MLIRRLTMHKGSGVPPQKKNMRHVHNSEITRDNLVNNKEAPARSKELVC